MTDEDKKCLYREMSEKLYSMYIIKNREDYLGSIKKYECIINNEKGLFKERYSMRSKDHIMEQVAYDIANVLGVRCCKASCRKSNGIYGSFSRFEIPDLHVVKPLEIILNASELDADELLDKILKLNNYKVNQFIIELYQYIIFDYIMGQQDRHLENISIVVKDRNIQLYPLYDNGLCCFSAYENDNTIQCLDRGFYSSRMGFSEDIYNTLVSYRDIIYNKDLRNIVRYHKLNKQLILDIIDKADKYNQMGKNRKEATANFIMKQVGDIHRLNIKRG